MGENIRLGFIGAGFIARLQARALTMVRGAELAGIFALDRADDLAGFAREHGLGECRVCASIDALAECCDVLALFTPNFARLENMEAIAAAVGRGAALRGVICEKPLGRTVAEARRLVDLARQAGLPTAYFENQVHMKAVKSALANVEEAQRAQGPMTVVRSSEEHGGPYEGWFWDPTRQGGGVLLDLGCHSISASWYLLTPIGKAPDYLKPVSVWAETSLLKWGRAEFRERLLEQTGVDYGRTPAEDYATGVVTFENPESGQRVKAQFTNSWLYDRDSMRLLFEGLGPGYGFEINTQTAPVTTFTDAGLAQVQPNDADVAGYVDELQDAVDSFRAGRDGLLSWDYGFEIARLCQAAYLSAERKSVIDLSDSETLEKYTSLIAQGRGAEVLFD